METVVLCFIIFVLYYCGSIDCYPGDGFVSDVQVPSGDDNKLSGGEAPGSIETLFLPVSQVNPGTGPEEALFKLLESKGNKEAKYFKKWRMGTVPYYIDEESYDSIITHRIHLAMKNIESASCVVFMTLENIPNHNRFGTDWLHITNPRNEKDCVHSTRIGSFGEVVLSLGYECIQKRDITHALLHVLGFKDEVTHPQRDSFVRVLWENIQPKYYHLFAIQHDPNPYETLVEYDTMSIMQFHDRAFSSNGGATITPLISGLLINPSEGLSQLDKMKLRLAFGHECNKRKVDNLFETCMSSIQLDKKRKDVESGSGNEDDGNSGSDANDEEDDKDGSESANENKVENVQSTVPGLSDNEVIVLENDDGNETEKSNKDKTELKGSKFGPKIKEKRDIQGVYDDTTLNETTCSM